MIHDQVQQMGRYFSLPQLKEIQTFLNHTNLSELQAPEVEIKGRDLFVRVMRYQPTSQEANKFEIHRVYADVQVLIKGQELMQVAKREDLESLGDYNAAHDYEFFTARDAISDLVVKEMEFVVFFPGEAHRPSCIYKDHIQENFKLVFKIKMNG